MSKKPLVIFLHFYQPPNQHEDILEKVVFESYRPILKSFLANPSARATFNFPAGLAELLIKKGFRNVIEQVSQLIQNGQIELTGTAAYHAFLPLLPKDEIRRQIQINEQGLAKYFGKTYKTQGFFPPELSFSYKVASIVEELGFKWMAIPMISQGTNIPDFKAIYKLSGYNLYLFSRHKWASAVILSGLVRNKKSFLDWLENESPVGYIITIMDAETFGHHRPGLESLLEELLTAAEFETLKVSDLFDRFGKIEEVKLREASWSNEEQDFWLDKERKVLGKNPFLLWHDPKNPIHKLQWKLTKLAIKTVHSLRPELRPRVSQLTVDRRKWRKARKLLDQALASDQYWWASAKPWWSLEMVEAGSWQLVKVIESVTKSRSLARLKAQEFYQKIIDCAFLWQRTGHIRKMHKVASTTANMPPFYKRAPKEWYNQIILEFEDEMAKAAKNLEFEKAIKWRDAIFKLASGADVFDILHIVDELQAVRTIPTLKPFLLHRKWEISKFAKSYLQELTKIEIEEGKSRLRQQGYKI